MRKSAVLPDGHKFQTLFRWHGCLADMESVHFLVYQSKHNLLLSDEFWEFDYSWRDEVHKQTNVLVWPSNKLQ